MGLIDATAAAACCREARSRRRAVGSHLRLARVFLCVAVVPLVLLSMGCDAATLFGGIYLPQGSGHTTYSTPVVSLETWADHVQFDSQHLVSYSNLTEDSVYVSASTIFLDVWANEPGEGLVCEGARITSDEVDKGGWQELPNSPWTAGWWGFMTEYPEESFDKGSVGVWIDHKTADGLEYDQPIFPWAFAGLTCESATTVITSPAWRNAIPYWETWSPPGPPHAPSDQATRWHSISMTCPGPCE